MVKATNLIVPDFENGSNSTKGVPVGWERKELAVAGILGDLIAPISEPTVSKGYFVAADPRVDALKKDVEALKNKISKFYEDTPRIANATISSLPTDNYELMVPLNVILKMYNDETIAIYPELELYGEGTNEMEALNDLKDEIIDLLEDLDGVPDSNLGADPTAWKKILNTILKPCQ